MGEIVFGLIELLVEVALLSRRGAPWAIILIVLALLGCGVYYFIGA